MHAIRALLTTGATALSVIVLSGCALACNEAGFDNTVEIEIADKWSDEASMALCSEDGCFAGEQLKPGSGRWAFDLFVVAPQDPEVTAFNAAGDEIWTKQTTVQWVSTSEPNGPGCTNRSISKPVTFNAQVSSR